MKMVKGLLLAGVIALVPACSSSKDTAEEEVTVDPKADADKPEAEAPAAPAPAAEPPPPPPAPAPAPQAEAPAPAPAAPVEPEGFNGPRSTHVVRVVAIKVHKLPNKESDVVGWVKRGDSVDVTINGEWAKLAPGRYISAKFFDDQAPAAAPEAAPAKAPRKKSKAK